MHRRFLPARRRSVQFLPVGVLTLLTMTGSAALLGDTPARIRSAVVDRCYCHCAQSRAHAGCAKMCELPKYKSRWWAVTCAKPHYQTPQEDSHAGPHLSHPDHAEHAKL